MNNNTYWFITGVANEGRLSTSNTRCWGFFDDFAEAEQAVLVNDGDIYECEYQYMVIEGHKMGVMGIMSADQYRHWYRWSKDEKKFFSVDTPDWAVNIVGWGIG